MPSIFSHYKLKKKVGHKSLLCYISEITTLYIYTLKMF